VLPESPEPEPVPEIDNIVIDRPLARRTLTVAFGMIGLALAGLTVIAVVLFIRVGDAIQVNHDAIRRLNRLTHPTPAQFEEDLKTGIQRCLRSPECRKLFPSIRKEKTQKSNGAKAPLARTPGRGVRKAEGQGGTAVPHSSRPTATTNPPRSRRTHKRGGGSGGSPPPQSSGSSPEPAITLTAPLPAKICAGSLLHVNCP
jgi:hypothetical protein